VDELMLLERAVIATGFVHARMIEYSELPEYERQFRAAVEERAPGVKFSIEYRAHPNSLLNSAGDRICVAVPLDG
jgi:hypothetical protein